MSILKKTRVKGLLAWGMLLAGLLFLGHPQAVQAGPTDDVTLAVEQVFTQPADSAADGTFTYTLTALQSGNPMPAGSSGSGYSFAINGSTTVSLAPITYSAAGTYRYEIEQTVVAEQTGYSYDRQVYTVEVYVTDTAGEIRADVVVYNESGLKCTAIVFQEAYQPLASDPSILVDPPVRKTVSGSPSVNGTFTFKLAAEDASNPMPTGSVDGVKLMTIEGPGEEDFGTWSYTRTGTYHYTISEVDNKESGYTYDEAIYTITDQVSDVNGQLSVARTITNTENEMVESYDFVNQYSGTSSTTKSSTGTSSTTKSSSLKGVKTGDATSLAAYQALLILGVAALAGCVGYWIRKQRKQRIDTNI